MVRHHYAAEDTAALDAILGRQYHAVVGNPPYITPKDPAMRDAYRRLYASCHMKYALVAPFTERFFDLAQTGTRDQAPGFVGLIVGNTFMKRSFGKNLIKDVLSKLDLTHIINCDGIALPGHGTPTVILLGRNRKPVGNLVRTVRSVRGDPPNLPDPALGPVWSAISQQVDLPGSSGDFVSVDDTKREVLARHPWSLGDGSAGEVKEILEEDRQTLSDSVSVIGVFGMTNADDIMLGDEGAFRRTNCEEFSLRPLVVGDAIRDWRILVTNPAIYPYNGSSLLNLSCMLGTSRFLWPTRTTLGNRATFGQKTYFAEGRPWWEWHQVANERLAGLTIIFAFNATHNHFVLCRRHQIYKQSAPIIKLPPTATEDDHLGLLGLLNSSVSCFWLKQVSHNKGSTVDDRGARQRSDPFEDFYEFTSAGLRKFPLADPLPIDIARLIDLETQKLSTNLPAMLCSGFTPHRDVLDAAHGTAKAAHARMIALQEELDWRCYRLYGLCDDVPEHSDPPGLRLGERAFEIVMARAMVAGTLETAWFSRHGSTPITDLPAVWPNDYRDVVERRIALIENDPTIGLIERPEYKRRWSMPPWAEMERDALRLWLLDRLEDARYWPADDPRLTSTRALADAARRDGDFLAVAELYVGRAGFDLDALVAELVAREAVPFLAALRYSETGLRKRADWEATWEKQRAEDAIDAALAARRPDFLRAAWTRAHARRAGESAEDYGGRMQAGLEEAAVQKSADSAIAAEAKQRKQAEVGAIPVPPKYRTPDFQSVDYWRLRGGLDVPKERFVSFPHCARDADGSLPVLWAGFDQLARARAISTWYVERKDSDGWPAARLVPLLVGLLELRPWLLQWHNDRDPASGERLGEYFASFIAEEARELGMTETDLRAWTPPAAARRTRRPRSAA